jgi:hypothetical protein
VTEPFERSVPETRGGDAHSADLSGRLSGLANPGLKPWAILFRHFMVGYPSRNLTTLSLRLAGIEEEDEARIAERWRNAILKFKPNRLRIFLYVCDREGTQDNADPSNNC